MIGSKQSTGAIYGRGTKGNTVTYNIPLLIVISNDNVTAHFIPLPRPSCEQCCRGLIRELTGRKCCSMMSEPTRGGAVVSSLGS